MSKTFSGDSNESPEYISNDNNDLVELGYQQKLQRTMGPFTSFALAFSMVSINTGIIALFKDPFTRVGGAGILLWLMVVPFVGAIVLVYAHLAGRMPITGYAYQWSSRLVNSHIGWFTGWIALISFIAGTAAISTAVGTVFAPEIWSHPTIAQVQGISITSVIIVCFLNIYGIRLATRINDIGAIIELIGTGILVLALSIGILFFFSHIQSTSVLVALNPIDGKPFTILSSIMGILLPISVLLGWDGAADLAEETLDPRRTAPKSMIKAFCISSIFGFILLLLLTLSINGNISDFFTSSENPVVLIIRVRLGHWAAVAMAVLALVSIFACLIANMAVATRMVFALSRDNMLPFSKYLGRVHKRRGTPDAAIFLVTAIAIVLNFMSGGFVNAIYSMVGLAYYLTYFLTLISVIFAFYKNKLPLKIEGVFDLGYYLIPIAGLGLLWAVFVIITLSISYENISGSLMMAAMVLVSLFWWLIVLRRKIILGEAGVPGSR